MKDIYHSIAHHSAARTIQQICSPLADKYCRIVRSESQYAISVVNIPNTGCGGVKQECSNENFRTGCGEVKGYSNEYIIQVVLGWSEIRIR